MKAIVRECCKRNHIEIHQQSNKKPQEQNTISQNEKPGWLKTIIPHVNSCIENDRERHNIQNPEREQGRFEEQEGQKQD